MVIEKQLTVPTLLVDEIKVRQNAKLMIERAKSVNVKLRPHFKTHQSIAIAQWMRQEKEKQQEHQDGGVDEPFCCTVSSLSMAVYFAQQKQFKDITVAFPFNIHEIQRVYDLLQCDVKLGLTIENVETIDFLFQKFATNDNDSSKETEDGIGRIGTTTGGGGTLRLWIKVDAGYHRTGVLVEDTNQILKLLHKMHKLCISSSPVKIEIAGILIHGGHSYDARGKLEIMKVHQETLDDIDCSIVIYY